MLSVVKVDTSGYDLKTLEPLRHLDRLFRLPLNYEKFEVAREAAAGKNTPELKEALNALHIARDVYEEDAIVAEMDKFNSAQHTKGYETVDFDEDSAKAQKVTVSSREMIFGKASEKSASSSNNLLKLGTDSDPTGKQRSIYLSNFNLIYRKLGSQIKDSDYYTKMNAPVTDLAPLTNYELLDFFKGLRVKDAVNYDIDGYLNSRYDRNPPSDFSTQLSMYATELGKAFGDELFLKYDLANSTLFKKTFPAFTAKKLAERFKPKA